MDLSKVFTGALGCSQPSPQPLSLAKGMEIPNGLNTSVLLFWGPRGRGFNSAPSRAQIGQGNPAPQISAQGGDRRLSCTLGRT